MRTLMIVPFHSVADVVTNSSSELFVCNTQQTAEQIREFFEEYAESTGNWHGLGDIKADSGPNALRDAILELEDWGQYFFEGILRQFVPLKELPDCSHIESPDYEPGRPPGWWEEYSEKMRVAINKYFEDHFDVLNQYIGNFCIIQSASDNSTSSEVEELIESTFNARRFHLG